jgi:signal transduction histidine kinase
VNRLVVILLIFVGVVSFSVKAYATPNNVDSLLLRLDVISEKEKPELLNKISASLLQSDSDKSLEFAQQAFLLSVSFKDRINEGKAQLGMAKIMFERGESEAVLPILRQCLIIAREQDSKELIAASLEAIAEYNYYSGNIEAALSNYMEELNYLLLPVDELEIAVVNRKLGGCLSEQGDYAKALDLFLSSLKTFEKRADKANVATVKSDIAANYQIWGNQTEALRYYEQSLTMYRGLNMLASQVGPLSGMAEIYCEQENYDKAAIYYRQCYGLGIMIANRRVEGVGMLGLGETFLRSGKIKEALTKTDAAGDIFREIGYVRGIADFYHLKGEIELEQGDQLIATDYFNQSLKLAEELEIAVLIGENLVKLSHIAEKNGEYKKAIGLYKKYSEVKDSAFNEGKTRLITEVQSRYGLDDMQEKNETLARDYSLQKSELKSKQIWSIVSIVLSVLFAVFAGIYLYFTQRKANKALELTVGIVSSQKNEFEVLNATKDKLFSIIGHDLRGSVGATKSMLYQLVRDPDVFPPEELKQIREELYHLSEDTYELLENLLSWAKSQREFKTYKDSNSIKKLVEYNVEQQCYFATKKNISLTSQLTDEYLVNCDRNMINLVLRNIISNAIKYTPEDGTIVVLGHKVDEYYKVSIKDSGVGILPENIARIFDSGDFFTTYGTNSEKGSGLGLLLCKEFVEKNGGELSVESTPGKGTTMSFTVEIGKRVNNLTSDKGQLSPKAKAAENN